jgi:hypothetical protein
MALSIVTLAVTASAFALFFRWYDQPPEMPGNIPNARLAAMFNERLALAVSGMTPARAPGLSERASASASSFIARVREVTQHCNFGRAGRPHNLVVFDLLLADGTVVQNRYNGGLRCPSPDVPGIPIMRIRFAGGAAVEITTDGSERDVRPVDVIPWLDNAIKRLIAYDEDVNPTGYFRASPTSQDLRGSWGS